MKPLYNVLEVGNYKFTTYYCYHMEKLGMKQSIYDTYLLENFVSWSIIPLQIDNLLFLVESQFVIKEEERIQETHLMSRKKYHLSVKKSI